MHNLIEVKTIVIIKMLGDKYHSDPLNHYNYSYDIIIIIISYTVTIIWNKYLTKLCLDDAESRDSIINGQIFQILFCVYYVQETKY